MHSGGRANAQSQYVPYGAKIAEETTEGAEKSRKSAAQRRAQNGKDRPEEHARPEHAEEALSSHLCNACWTFLGARLDAIHLEAARLGESGGKSQFVPTVCLNPFPGCFFKMVEHDLARLILSAFCVWRVASKSRVGISNDDVLVHRDWQLSDIYLKVSMHSLPFALVMLA